MVGMVGIGLFCVLLGLLVTFADPLDIYSAPFTTGLLWVFVGVACFGAAWKQARDNHATTAQWYERLAERGDAYAMYQLGRMYGRGQGVRRDYVMAHMWFALAANHGSAAAIGSSDDIASKMSPSQIAQAERLAQEWKLEAGASAP